MKHNKGQCLIFLESRLPCEDCDLEGHSATCGWHIDWHSCSCEAFDKKGNKMRYEVEPELEIAKGCRCLSCWEQTGKWLVVDKQSDAEDLVFDSEEEAEEWVKQNER